MAKKILHILEKSYSEFVENTVYNSSQIFHITNNCIYIDTPWKNVELNIYGFLIPDLRASLTYEWYIQLVWDDVVTLRCIEHIDNHQIKLFLVNPCQELSVS